MKTLKTTTLSPQKNYQFIAEASDIFSYIDSDFKKWGTDTETNTTPFHPKFSVNELDKDSTFKDIFTDPENMCLSQEQIIQFCRDHREDLRQDGYGTFFLFKVGSDFFVACVGVSSGGLGVYADRFSFDRVWFAEFRLRFVVPQLTTIPLASDHLALGHLVTLPDELVINNVTYVKK